MGKSLVAVVRYEKPVESVRQAVELSHGLDHLPTRAKVFIKPNIDYSVFIFCNAYSSFWLVK